MQCNIAFPYAKHSISSQHNLLKIAAILLGHSKNHHFYCLDTQLGPFTAWTQ